MVEKKYRIWLENLKIEVPVFKLHEKTAQAEILLSDIPKNIAKRAHLKGKTVKYWYGKNGGGNRLIYLEIQEPPSPGSASPIPPARAKQTLSFPDAMQAIIGAGKVRRLEWADTNEYCLLKDNFLMIHRNNDFHTWIVSEGDMSALDWVIC